ncbi:MAG: hypothetical protein ACLQQB_03685 [Solirubrobacteraceae bacterium]
MKTARPPKPARSGAARTPAPGRRLETWLWTGPVGHLIGGGLDFAHALARYLLARARGKAVR